MVENGSPSGAPRTGQGQGDLLSDMLGALAGRILERYAPDEVPPPVYRVARSRSLCSTMRWTGCCPTLLTASIDAGFDVEEVLSALVSRLVGGAAPHPGDAGPAPHG
ncbi:hypothetical protein ABT023_07220 [Micromonospora sp. NPDC002296]|uniref:hypothetical protein n=1 Tax=Micromonospora sp. NPDC002296 TaxID=3154271 RepID=UPI0033227652